YNVNPFYTDPSDLNNFYRIVQANKEGTNWFQEIFDPASIQSHDVSVSGGSEQGSYIFSMNYFDQQGTLMNTYLKRYTLRSNTSFNITENFRIGENLAFSYTDNRVLMLGLKVVLLEWPYGSSPLSPYMTSVATLQD